MKLEFINARGDVMPLTNNEYFNLVNVDGQTTASTNISSITTGGVDGDSINNIQAQPRTIVCDLKIKQGVNVEDAKREILSVVKLKRSGALKWTQNNRTVTISGVVESVDMPRWENNVLMQITLHCAQPFWEDIDYVVNTINQAIALHYFTDAPNDMLYFPFDGIPLSEYDIIRTQDLYNTGDVAVGLDIEVLAYDTVTNPIITNQDGNFFGVGYGTGTKQIVMSAGDVINISTHKGQKTVKLNGTSVIAKIKPNSTWLQLEAGDNTFAINSDDVSTNNVGFTLSYKRRFI